MNTETATITHINPRFGHNEVKVITESKLVFLCEVHWYEIKGFHVGQEVTVQYAMGDQFATLYKTK
jgi:hypothetical protein